MLVPVLIFLILSATTLAVDEEVCEYGGKKIKVGEYFNDGPGCGSFLCESPGRMSGSSCGTYFPNPDSECEHIPPDDTKPYPDCCERYVNCKKREPVIATYHKTEE